MSDPSTGALPPHNVPGSLPTSGTHPGQPPGKTPEPDYSGFWVADDGGMYFIRQFDTVLWWVGVNRGDSRLAPALCPGLQFCNVYHASVTGPDITGDWSDVPRGATSNRGTLTLTFADGLLRKVGETGGFSACTWQQWPMGDTQWPVVVSAAETFQQTFKNAIADFHSSQRETLADNLRVLKETATVFAVISLHVNEETGNPEPIVSAASPPVSATHETTFTYDDFICLNQDNVGGVLGQNDCDVGFHMQTEANQIAQRQPRFYDEIDEGDKFLVYQRLPGVGQGGFEGEIIMYGRSADCGDDAEKFATLFPGWNERADSPVLFNGKPITIKIPGSFGGAEPNFVNEVSIGDLVRVTGVLVFDQGHRNLSGDFDNPYKLEIHPVYSVDKIMAMSSGSSGLSGAWTDDVGNTYYLRHDPADDTVWYAGLSPLGSAAFAQVFRGTFYPPPVIKDSAIPAIPKGIGTSPVTPPQNVLIGDVVAIDLGWGTAPPFEVSGTRLGDTGAATFVLGSTQIAAANVLTLSIGSFRLMKLYDA